MHLLKIIVFFILSSFLVSGCSDPPSKQADKVTIQLKFVHQAQFAGIYIALERGFYAVENIELTFIEGGRGIDLIEPVISGKAHFGIAASDLILARRIENKPVKAIAAIYRRCAAAFVTLKESGIINPQGMIGKNIAVISKNAKEYEFQFRAMMKRLGLDISRTQLLPLEHQYSDFLMGEIDVTGAYITGGAMRLKAKGKELNTIWPGDYGIHFYSDTIFTHENTIRDNPDLVERFLRATIKGWNEAIANPDFAVEATMKYARIKDKQLQTDMMDAQYPLIYTGEDSVGWMKEEIWSGMNAILHEENIVPKRLKNINDVYTTEFLEKIKEDTQ